MNQPEQESSEPLTIVETSEKQEPAIRTVSPGVVPAIEMKNVAHTFKNHPALDGVTFQVAKG